MKEEIFYSVIYKLSSLIEGTKFENHTFCVGGCVRDELMDNEIKDIDIAVDLQQGGIELAEYLYSINALVHTPVTYPSYSTAMFVLRDFPDVELEAVQTRKEKYEDKTNRNPTTAFGTQEEDCFRRDLTINSLYRNISTGRIVDITGRGLSDIKNHIIRTPLPPDETFDDDPLRMLRVIRFASRYGWSISDETFESIKKNANRLAIITKERIHDELNKILSTNRAGFGMQMIIESGLFKYIFEMPEQTDDMYAEIINGVTGLSYVDYRVRLACIFYILHEDSSLIYYRLNSMKYSTDDANYIKKLIDIISDNIDSRTGRTAELISKYGKDGYCRYIKYLCGTEGTFVDMENLLIPCLSVDDDNIIKILYQSHNDVKDNLQFFGFKLPLDGYDLKKELDIKPSPIFGKYLEMCREEMFKNPSLTKAELIEFIKSYHIANEHKN